MLRKREQRNWRRRWPTMNNDQHLFISYVTKSRWSIDLMLISFHKNLLFTKSRIQQNNSVVIAVSDEYVVVFIDRQMTRPPIFQFIRFNPSLIKRADDLRSIDRQFTDQNHSRNKSAPMDDDEVAVRRLNNTRKRTRRSSNNTDLLDSSEIQASVHVYIGTMITINNNDQLIRWIDRQSTWPSINLPSTDLLTRHLDPPYTSDVKITYEYRSTDSTGRYTPRIFHFFNFNFVSCQFIEWFLVRIDAHSISIWTSAHDVNLIFQPCHSIHVRWSFLHRNSDNQLNIWNNANMNQVRNIYIYSENNEHCLMILWESLENISFVVNVMFASLGVDHIYKASPISARWLHNAYSTTIFYSRIQAWNV